MTLQTRAQLQASSDVVKNETAANANTATRVGSVLRDLADSALVSGSIGSTDNAVLRADGTGGSTAQGSLVTIDDAGNFTTPKSITGERIYSFEASNRWQLQVSPDITIGGTAASGGGTRTLDFPVPGESPDGMITGVTGVFRGIQATTGYLVKIEVRADYYRVGGNAVYLANSLQVVRKQVWDPSDGSEQSAVALNIDVAASANSTNARFTITNNDPTNAINFTLGCSGATFGQSLSTS